MKFLLAMVFSISRRLAVISVSALSVSAMLWPSAWAQNQGDLVGTWMVVKSVTEKDGARTDQFGVGAKGMLSLDADGHFMLTILGPDLPRFVSNNRATGTQQEDKAVVSKSIAMIGSYSFHASDKAPTFKVESATFPNWNATEKNDWSPLSAKTN